MSKTKPSTLPHYELLYIISNQFSENEIPPIKETIEKLITDNQGEITVRQDWGKKKLAYPIKHFRHGYYQLLEFDMPASGIKTVDNNLRLSDQILRHQIVKKDKDLPQPTAQPVKSEATPEAQETTSATKSTEEEIINKPTKTSSTNEDKVELQDLDDKLDKILDSESFF